MGLKIDFKFEILECWFKNPIGSRPFLKFWKFWFKNTNEQRLFFLRFEKFMRDFSLDFFGEFTDDLSYKKYINCDGR